MTIQAEKITICIECGHKLYHHKPFCCVGLCPCGIFNEEESK
mgnify:CR=1 FL=1